MWQRLGRTIFWGIMIGQLLCSGCLHQPTIERPAFKPYRSAQPLTEKEVHELKKKDPNDAVFVDLLQAFAMLRTDNLNDPKVRKLIKGHLIEAVQSFEDLSDPVNFSMAFSADENKPYRGMPYERVLASILLAVFEMSENNCPMAQPSLLNAEFLDARFQKMPFGTDAPLIYALMLRCLALGKKSEADINRAKDGLYRSIRFLTLQEPLLQVLLALSDADIRSHAVSNRLAYMMYEVGIYNALMTEKNHASLPELLKAAAQAGELFLSAVHGSLADDFEAKIKPMIKEAVRIEGKSGSKAEAQMENWAFENVRMDLYAIAQHMQTLIEKGSNFKNRVHKAMGQVPEVFSRIAASAVEPKLVLQFSGEAPTVVREGAYNEIATIVTSPDGSDKPHIRIKKIHSSLQCGFHRAENGGFTVVLCDEAAKHLTTGSNKVTMQAYELWSSSRKAKMVAGRRFEKILKGRAQFRVATEQIADISVTSAFILFHMASRVLNECNRRESSDACYAQGFALLAAAGVTVGFAGAVWLVGKTKNPEADSRFVHLMYESVWFGV